VEQEADGKPVPGGGSDSGSDPELTLEVADSVSSIDPVEWDALIGEGDESPPFLEHRFLASLEDADTLGEQSGWIPRIPIVRRGERIVAAAPAYVKLHSMGEFVFDWSWAEAAERLGIAYYPKLLVGVPFTPIAGRRLLTRAGEDRPKLIALLGKLLIELCDLLSLSSVHVNFAMEDEIAALESAGFLVREGIQYHWMRRGAASFEDYLARFNSKRRNQIRRERREIEKQGATISVIRGEELRAKEMIDIAFGLYRTTIDKFYWGRQYLNRDVFRLWAERMSGRLEMVAAKVNGDIVGGAINFAGARRLYGRYWGCFTELRHLHFSVCYYAGIEECCARGLDVFEPGAGGEHKLTRGFEPTITRSAHWIQDRRFRAMLAPHLSTERAEMRRHRESMLAAMGMKEETSS
jgi:uncharacterized protein